MIKEIAGVIVTEYREYSNGLSFTCSSELDAYRVQKKGRSGKYTVQVLLTGGDYAESTTGR